LVAVSCLAVNLWRTTTDSSPPNRAD
jgi:hypothetical protein